MENKNILWFSQHTMSKDQEDALKLAYGENIVINQVNKTVNSMFDIKPEIEAADIVCMVGTVDMQAQAIKIAGDRPVLTAVSDRILEKDENGIESKAVFVFNRWEQVKKISVNKEEYVPESTPKTVLWVSRHQMTPDQAAALGIDENTKIVQIDKTLKNMYEIQDEIKNADVVAVVAPVGLQQQALKIAEGRPVVTAVSDRIPQPDGSYKFQFNHWDKINSITIDKDIVVNMAGLENWREQRGDDERSL